ncbi:MAG: DUF6186 family protein [Acidimicrobiales bacterium]
MSTRHLTLVVWAGLGALILGAQAVALAARGRLCGIGAVVGRLKAREWVRVVLVLAWMWLGWHAFAR